MQTITIDGKEYVLIPREQLQPVPEPAQSVLADFVELSDTYVDDGLSSHKDKQAAIQVVEQTNIVDEAPTVKKADGKEYEYRTRFLNHELIPSDVFSVNRGVMNAVKRYKDVGSIEADKSRPPEHQMFYGEGLTSEGSGMY